MIALSMLSLGVLILLAAMTAFSVVAMQHSSLQPATVNPFGPVLGHDTTSETLTNSVSCENTLNGDWHSVELHRLCDVEDMLDNLEACHAAKTELEFTANDRFTVRWR